MTFVNPYRHLHELATSVHGSDQPFGLVEMRREAGVVVESPTVRAATFQEHRKRLWQHGQHEKELYMQLGVTISPSMRVSDVSHAWALAVDFDEGLPNLCRPGEPLQPTWLIETSPSRHQGVFLLESSVDADRLGRFARGVARRLGGDMAFAKTNQMVRVPGFPNQKYEDVWVKLSAHRGPTYQPDWLWTACDIDLYEASTAWIPGAILAGQHGTDESPKSTLEHAREAAMYLAGRGWAASYDQWFKVVVNLAAQGEAARVVAHEFSQAAPTQYEPAAVDLRFDRWLRDGTGDVKTLFGIAQREGWENPGPDSFAGTTQKAAVSDRDIGRRLAKQLQDHFAAIDIPGAPKGTPPAFMKWNGKSYELLDDRRRRYEIEATSKSLAARLPADASPVAAALLRNIGSNRSLDSVCEHVAEALVPLCDPRVVRHYPYLPVQNGVLNLLTRELVLPHCRAIPLGAIPVVFDPQATAPRFRAFLGDVLLGDQRLMGYLKRLLGYSLLGKPKEQVFPIFLGPTAGNGKSVIFDVLLEMLGPFAARLKTEAIMQKSHISDGANPAIAALAGKRLVIAAEPNDKHRFDTSTVKQLVGERSSKARRTGTDWQPHPAGLQRRRGRARATRSLQQGP